MKQRGKRAVAWEKTRRQWIKDNPPSFEGFWWCVYCGEPLDKYSLTLDHVLSRSRRPDLLTDHANLKPCCGLCNSIKGST